MRNQTNSSVWIARVVLLVVLASYGYAVMLLTAILSAGGFPVGWVLSAAVFVVGFSTPYVIYRRSRWVRRLCRRIL
jgi:uncharacterized membrane protein (DUF485 family)